MKIKPFLSVVLFFSACLLHGQNEIKIKKSEDLNLVKVLNKAEFVSKFTDEYLSVKVYQIDNGTGSAGFPSSEVSHSYLIAVSEFDETPNHSLFEIGPFYYSSTINWNGKGTTAKEFEIEYGALKDRKVAEFVVSIQELKREE